jgi:hypothetical protein
MAIKDNKIPSPSNIKSSPQVFSSKELNNIKTLREEINGLAIQFGHLYISKIKLEEQEKLLKDKMSSLETNEKNLAKELTSKYGKGSIDLETGTFTPLT